MVKYWIYRLKWHLAKWVIWRYPLHIDIELTSLCNLKCGFCPHSEQTPFYKGFMPMSMFEMIIDEIQGRVPSIKLNLRGESTLHPQFEEMCNYVKGKFIDIRLNTNGQYDQDLNDTMSKVFTEVSFSVDTIDKKQYKKIRNGDRELLWGNITDLYCQNPDIVKISMTVSKDSADTIELTKEFVELTYPKAKIYIKPVMNRTAKDYMLGDKLAVDRKNCYMPNRRLSVGVDGKVFPCCLCWSDSKYLAVGNVTDAPLLDIWKNERMGRIRHRLRTKEIFTNYSDCGLCGSSESYVWEKI